MQTKWIMLSVLAAILAMSPGRVMAEDGQVEQQTTSAAAPRSLAEAWQAIQTNQVLLHKIIDAGKLDEVKAVAFEIRDLAHALPEFSGRLTPDKEKKLRSGLTQIDESAARLDKYGSAGEKTGSEIEAHEMDILLASLAVLYSAPDVAATLEYTCPMHPEVNSDKPGRCPICGMPLVIREDSKE